VKLLKLESCENEKDKRGRKCTSDRKRVEESEK
jgi:hypothetical protein